VIHGFDPALIVTLSLAGTFVSGLSGGAAGARADSTPSAILSGVVALIGGVIRDPHVAGIRSRQRQVRRQRVSALRASALVDMGHALKGSPGQVLGTPSSVREYARARGRRHRYRGTSFRKNMVRLHVLPREAREQVSMTKIPFEERRGPHRPTGGARRPCPGCGGSMRFFERYRVRRGKQEKAEPAWVCACGHELFVRNA